MCIHVYPELVSTQRPDLAALHQVVVTEWTISQESEAKSVML